MYHFKAYMSTPLSEKCCKSVPLDGSQQPRTMNGKEAIMPRPRTPHFTRVAIRCEPWFSDALDTAAKLDNRSMSGFVRQACIDRMRLLGVPIPGEAPAAK